MNPAIFLTLERLLTTLWVGGLWGIGYLAVPILFSQLDDRMLAGALAGHMFTALSYVGLVAGSLLLTMLFLRTHAPWRRSRLVLLGVMALLVCIGEYWLQPVMAELKRGGLVAGSEQAAAFARLHGIAALLYLSNSIMGLVVVALGVGESLNRAAG